MVLFQHQMEGYVTATKTTGQDCVIQFLGFCEEDLWKDLTRAARSTLTAKTEEEVLAAITFLAV